MRFDNIDSADVVRFICGGSSYLWRVYRVTRKLLQKDSEKGGGLMKMGEYYIGDILFSTANPNYAYTVLEIDHGGNRVKLIPNYRRDGDKNSSRP